MQYRLYGRDIISKEPRPPLDIEADTEEVARAQAAEMGMEVLQVEPPPSAVAPPTDRIGHLGRWWRQRPGVVIAGALLAVAAVALLVALRAGWLRREVVDPREAVPGPKEMARRQQYADQMSLVQRAWDDGQMGRVAELLRGLEPQPDETDLRGFEWHYLERQCPPQLVTLEAPGRCAFSPDGRRLAAVQGGNVRVWDLHERQEVRSFPAPGDTVTSLSLSAGGAFLAAAGSAVVKVWDVAAGKEIRSFEGHGKGALLVALSPDGKRLAHVAADTPDTVKVVEVATGNEVCVLKGADRLTRVTYSPDGQRLATVSAGRQIRLWDAGAGTELLKLPGGEAAAFHPDGTRLAGVTDGGVTVWDIQFGRDARPAFGAGAAGWAAAPGGPGPWLAVAALLAAQPGREVLTLKADPDRAAKDVAFSPDGQRLAVAGPDGRVALWTAAGKEMFTLKGHTQAVTDLAFLADGRRLVTAAGDGTVRGWDVTSSPEFTSPQPVPGAWMAMWGGNFRYAWSEDGRQLLIAETSTSSWQSTSGGAFHRLTVYSPTMSLWDTAAGKATAELFPAGKARNSLAMSRDGRRIAVATDDGRIHVLHAPGGSELFTLPGQPRAVAVLAFAPDGEQLASAEDRSVRLWDLRAGREARTLSGHTGPVTTVVYQADGRQLLSVARGDAAAELKVWDVATGKELSSVKGPPLAWGKSAAISPAGRRVASIDGKEVQVWDAGNGKVLQTLRGHTDDVQAVAFSPDGQRLVTGGQDGRTTIWDAFTGRELLSLKESSDALSFSPDGKRLVGTAFEYRSEGDDKVGWHSRENAQVRLREATELSEEGRTARWRSLGEPAGAPEPDRSGWGELQRLGELVAKGKLDQALADLTQAIEQRREQPWYWQARGHVYARQQQWDKAAADFAEALRRNGDDLGAWDGFLHVRLQLGDEAGYRQGCADMLAHFGQPDPPGDANTLAWLCVLAPGAVVDSQQPVRLAEKAVAKNKDWNNLDTLGAALFRAGRYQDAAARLEESIKMHGKGGDGNTWLFLAMTRQRLGEKTAAKTCLDKALSALNQAPARDSTDWCARLELQLRRREAESLLRDAAAPPK